MRSPLALTAIGILVLAGCTAPDDIAEDSTPLTSETTSTETTSAEIPEGDVDSLLAAHGLDGMGGEQVVELLDETSLADRPEGLMASVRYDEVLVSVPDWAEPAPLALDGDKFYLSFAPYVDSTHECYFHSLTTCVGELGGEDFDVLITDSATGEVVIDETVTTFDNGFAGVWLPRDIDATLRVEGEAGVSEGSVSTGPEDPTCLTTVRLA